jgi:glutathione synthase
VTCIGGLEAVGGRARAAGVCLGPDLSVASSGEIWLDETAAVFMRTDPPVDEPYLNATFVLDLVDPGRTAMVNDPRGLRLCNEKLYALRFADLLPTTVVTSRAATIGGFVAQYGRSVLKPIDGHAGAGIVLLDPADPNLCSLIEISTRGGRRGVVVQRFLPEVADGNKRIFLLDGRPTGAVWRYPRDGDFRTGDPQAVAPVSARDVEICARIAPSLLRDGLRMVGLDVIGTHLIEINVTSPGALHKSDVRLGTSLCADVMDAVTGSLEPAFRRGTA